MRWRFPEHLAWQALGDEVVVIDLRSGTAIGLNPTGTAIWPQLERADEAEICAELSRRFSVDERTAAADLLEFTRDLCARGLLLEVTESER
jgi:hypothetical protein